VSSVNKSILLVDDDQEIRELLETYLTRAGFQVRATADGASFRQALNDAPSDLVILDVMLPDEDGFSLCRWVRQHPRQAQVPIIMLTASSDEADRVIGLELGQALHRLGVRTHLYGRSGSIGPLTDPRVIDYAAAQFAGEFPVDWTADVSVGRDGDQVVIRSAAGEERFDFLLAATGRQANVDKIGLENTSLVLDARGVPNYDRLSMRAGYSDIFVAGDAAIDVSLLHEAADEGRVAGENAARFPHSYRRKRRTPLTIVFSDPQIAIAGRSHAELLQDRMDFAVGEVSFDDQGRSRVMGLNRGILRIYGDRPSGLLLGAELIGPSAEHLAHLIAWSIESRLTVPELLERPFYHPVIEEGLRTALRHLNHELGFGPNPPLRCIDCGPGG